MAWHPLPSLPPHKEKEGERDTHTHTQLEGSGSINTIMSGDLIGWNISCDTLYSHHTHYVHKLKCVFLLGVYTMYHIILHMYVHVFRWVLAAMGLHQSRHIKHLGNGRLVMNKYIIVCTYNIMYYM